MKPTHTPPRSVRVPTTVWDVAMRNAAARGETVTDVVNRALRAYNESCVDADDADRAGTV